MAKRVEGQAPDNSAVLRQNMKAERAAVDRCRPKNANMDEFAMMRFAVVEEFLAQKAIFKLATLNVNVPRNGVTKAGQNH